MLSAFERRKTKKALFYFFFNKSLFHCKMGDMFVCIHGTVMILAWMGFGGPGMLFARYGRVLRLGNKRQLLGKSIWFQIHRFYLSVSALLTLFGFFFITINGYGAWINSADASSLMIAHSIIGTLVLCGVILQIWLALYRCHPNSRFRFLFNWSHRIIGNFSFIFALCNIFIMAFVLTTYQIVLIVIVCLWTMCNLITVICFEIIQYYYRKASRLLALNIRVNSVNNQENLQRNSVQDVETINNPTVDNPRLNRVRLVLFLTNYFISFSLCIPIIVLIWLQN